MEATRWYPKSFCRNINLIWFPSWKSYSPVTHHCLHWKNYTLEKLHKSAKSKYDILQLTREKLKSNMWKFISIIISLKMFKIQTQSYSNKNRDSRVRLTWKIRDSSNQNVTKNSGKGIKVCGNNVAYISQQTYFNAFSWKEIFVFWFKFYWNCSCGFTIENESAVPSNL